MQLPTVSAQPPPARLARSVAPSLLLALRLACLAALAISIYLLHESLTHRNEPLGCGAGSDCSQILTSRWSMWFSIPVSAPAAGIYFLLFLASLGVGSVEPLLQRIAWRLLAIFAPTALGAGIWFMAVQKAAMHRFCPWCASVHFCALLIVLLLILARRGITRPTRQHQATSAPHAPRLWPWTMLSIIPLAALIAGQVRPARQPAMNHVVAAAGKLQIDPSEFPIVGNPNAPHTLIVMADYCCPHCRRMHAVIERAQTRYGSQLAIAMLPVPINASCNPAIHTTPANAIHACELAKLALAVWQARPAAFAQMNDWMFEGDQPPEVEVARSYAERLVGDEALRAAHANPLVNATLQKSVQAYADLDAGAVPKAILPNSVLSGEVQDETAFYELMEREMHIQPAL